MTKQELQRLIDKAWAKSEKYSAMSFEARRVALELQEELTYRTSHPSQEDER
jgi:hypothetical protein